MVAIVFGLPGSGKSYFASRLAAKLNAVYLSTDVLRKKLFSKSSYTEAEKMLVYDAMLTALSEALIVNNPVVMDGTFYKALLRTKFEEKAAQYSEQIIYIEVAADENLIENRLNLPRQYSEANFEVYLKLKEAFEPLLNSHLTLNSSNDNIDLMLTKAIEHIQTRI